MSVTPDQYLLAVADTIDTNETRAVPAHAVNARLGIDVDTARSIINSLSSRGLVEVHPGAKKLVETLGALTLTDDGRQEVATLRATPDQPPTERLVDEPMDEWSTIDLPLLRLAARAEQAANGNLAIDDIERHLGVSRRKATASMWRLKRTGLLECRAYGTEAWAFIHLTEKGLQLSGVWPTPEEAVERLIRALIAIADNESLPEKDRTKARKFAAWMGKSANTIGLDIAGAILAGQVPGM